MPTRRPSSPNHAYPQPERLPPEARAPRRTPHSVESWPARQAEGQSEMLRAYRDLGTELGGILASLKGQVREGQGGYALAALVEAELRRRRLDSTFLAYYGYPSVLSLNPNDHVVHTPPSSRVLRQGDLLKVELGVMNPTAFAQQTWTFCVGEVDETSRRLISSGLLALRRAVAAAREGRVVRDLSWEIQRTVEGAGFSVNRDYVGHGMGVRLTQSPRVPMTAWPDQGGERLERGMILNLLVIAHAQSPECYVDEDAWSVRSRDGLPAVAFSNEVLVGVGGGEPLLEELATHGD